MDSYRDEYTINPEIGRKIKLGTQTWKRLASMYYMVDGKFTDQPIPDSWAYLSNKVFGVKEVIPKRQVTHRRVSDPKGKRKYLIVGSKAWNERFLEYEWNGHEFGDKRGRPLPEFMNTVEKTWSTSQQVLRSVRSQSDRGTLVGRDRLVTRVCTHILSHCGGRYVQGMDERETNQEGLSPQERWWQ